MSLMRCQEGHLFSPRRYGSSCPYCNKTVALTKKHCDPAYDSKTPYLGDLEVMDPVTGWLVCIEGGRIMTEKNFLGRGETMDIQILGDNHIAKKNHAVFVYDTKKRKTLILPKDAQGLVYVNDEAVYTPQELSVYDTIELGKSKFIFIPLWGENFEWSELDDRKG